jgi:hypothetical protein
MLAMRLSAFYSVHNKAKVLDPEWIVTMAEDWIDKQEELDQHLVAKYNEGLCSERIVSMTRPAEEFAQLRQRLEETDARLQQHEAEAKHELEQSREELEAKIAELESDVKGLCKGASLSYSRIKTCPKLQSRLGKFTPFKSMEALDTFLDWINHKGVAERLIVYRKARCKPNNPIGDNMKRLTKERLLDWKDQFLMTMTYIYSGTCCSSSNSGSCGDHNVIM